MGLEQSVFPFPFPTPCFHISKRHLEKLGAGSIAVALSPPCAPAPAVTWRHGIAAPALRAFAGPWPAAYSPLPTGAAAARQRLQQLVTRSAASARRLGRG